MSKSPESQDFIREIIANDIQSGKHTAPITRFPPEPNGYLHIGHAKALTLNFGIAAEYAAQHARCHLRFDDTNPTKEDTSYVESIQQDITWLGFDWQDSLYFASDYFDFFYQKAQLLIEKGLAYVDFQNLEEIRATRGNVKIAGNNSPYRDSSVEDNLAHFAAMKRGDFPDGHCVLRAKIDMSSPNMNLRDPIFYRILHSSHHRTGKHWCIYPNYDFAHPLEDAKEGITHSLCSLEFEDHRPLYNWVIEHCDVPHRPRQIEFSRLNLSYTVMSKRYIAELITNNIVSDWDDPRLPTLSGMRNRGYPPQAIIAFCQRIGITKFNGLTDVSLLELEVRKHLNEHSYRKMAVLEPLLVEIENWQDEESLDVSVANHPENPAFGERTLTFGKYLWIEQSDFLEEAPKKFFRLTIGGSVRLRGAYIITCTRVEKSANGNINKIICRYIPDTIGKKTPEGIRCKAAIHWLNKADARDACIHLYQPLFLTEQPDTNDLSSATINPHSIQQKTTAKVEASIQHAELNQVFQFERLGYFKLQQNTANKKIICYQTIALKDNKKK